MVDGSKTLDAIGALYDCVAEPSRWPSTLATLSDLTGSVTATLAVLDTSDETWRFSAAHGDPDLLGPLFTTYAEHMPFNSILHRFELDIPLDFDGICNLYGPDGLDVWNSSRLHREWVTPNRLRLGINLAVIKQENRLGFFNTTTRDDEPLNETGLGLAATLAPHIRRSVTIGDLLETELTRVRAFEEVIDNLSHPVVIVTRDMRILYANPAAEVQLRSEVSVRQTEDRLVFTYAPAHTAISHAIALGHRDEFVLGTAGLHVPLVKMERPSVAHILPLARRERSVRTAEKACAAIFIAAPGINPVPAIEAIAALFGLTAMEKRVATLVAEGRTRGEIAMAHGVSDHTVKTQLGIIYDKTNTRDQRQLQLLMKELTPPVRPAASSESGKN